MDDMCDAGRLIMAEEPTIAIGAARKLAKVVGRQGLSEGASANVGDDSLLVAKVTAEFLYGSGLALGMRDQAVDSIDQSCVNSLSVVSISRFL